MASDAPIELEVLRLAHVAACRLWHKLSPAERMVTMLRAPPGQLDHTSKLDPGLPVNIVVTGVKRSREVPPADEDAAAALPAAAQEAAPLRHTASAPHGNSDPDGAPRPRKLQKQPDAADIAGASAGRSPGSPPRQQQDPRGGGGGGRGARTLRPVEFGPPQGRQGTTEYAPLGLTVSERAAIAAAGGGGSGDGDGSACHKCHRSRDVVRDAALRQQMRGGFCDHCDAFYAAVFEAGAAVNGDTGAGGGGDAARLLQQASRHRAAHVMGAEAREGSPPQYWSLHDSNMQFSSQSQSDGGGGGSASSSSTARSGQ